MKEMTLESLIKLLIQNQELKTLKEIKSEIENEIVPSDGNWSWDTSNVGLRKSIQIIEEHIKHIMEEN